MLLTPLQGTEIARSFSFLSWPAELRLRVYYLLLVKDHTISPDQPTRQRQKFGDYLILACKTRVRRSFAGPVRQ